MGKTVLVVDDDPEFAQMLNDVLTAEGYTVIACTEPGSAYQEARRLMPDTLIVDLVMPGISGWEILEQIRGDPATARTHLIVCTAHPTVAGDGNEKLAKMGCDLLTKPFDLDELLRLLRKA